MQQDIAGNNNTLIGGDNITNNYNYNSPHEEPYVVRFFYHILLFSLVATTLPSATINFIFCLATIVSAVALFRISKKHLVRPFVLLLVGASLLSGCGPLLVDNDFESQLIDVGLCGDDNQCKKGTDKGLYVFGIMVDQASVSTATRRGNIDQLKATSISRGHGIISVAQIDVYGE